MAQPERLALRVTHRLPIGGEEVERVLMRLRRDTPDQRISWTLGDHGACELEAGFVPLPVDGSPTWAASARLWDRSHLALAPIAITVTSRGDEECELEARPGVLTPFWQRNAEKYVRLARAALEELSQELLWCATSMRRDQRT
jgi:hypothetical protein